MNKYVAFLASLVFLSGCHAVPASSFPASSTSSSPQIQSESHVIDDISLSDTPLTDFENLYAANVSSGSIVPSGSGDGLLKLGTAVLYCDPDVSGQFAYYCFEPGCRHNDPSCHSYIGNAGYFIASNGLWYYSRQNGQDQFEIVCHNPESNERKVIAQYEHSDDGRIWEVIENMILSHGCLYVMVQRFETAEDTMQQTSSTYIDAVNLQTYERQILDNCNDQDSFLCGNGKKAVIIHHEPRTSVNGDDYVYTELSLLDFLSEERVTVADSDHSLSVSDPFQLMNQNTFVYLASNQIHLLDLETMDDRMIYSSDKELVRAWLFGSHVRFLEKEADGSALVESMIDFDGNNRQDYPQLIDSGKMIMKFGYQYLTEHGQIGSFFLNDQQVYGWISEENYLRCDLNQIVSAKA